MREGSIDDAEQLYRSVQNEPEIYFPVVNGVRKFSSQVFNDRSQKISVDLASLRESPADTKWNPTDGVVYLVTQEVRGITNICVQGENGPCYAFDVFHRPVLPGNGEGLPENQAHAQIEASPHFVSSSRFKKLKEALALIVSQRPWLVEPT